MIAKRSLVLVAGAAACGSPHHTHDAGLIATPDSFTASTADAAPGAVSVRVVSSGQPAGGVGVYFQQADGTLVAALATDEQGTANAMVGAGGFVTVLEPSGSGAVKLDTFAGVKPDDHLELALGPFTPTASVTFTLTVPTVADSQSRAAGAYAVYTPCGNETLGSSGSGDMLLGGCTTAADMLVVPYDVDGNPIGSLFEPNVAITCASGCSAVIPSTDTYTTPFATAAFAYAHVPTDTQYIGTTQSLRTHAGRLIDASTGVAPTGDTANSSVPVPVPQPAPAAVTAMVATDAVPAMSAHSEQIVYDWRAPWQDTYTLDFATVSLPAYQSEPSYEFSSRTITWTEAGPGAGGTAQLARAQLSVTRPGIPASTSWTWSIVAPRGATPAITFPTLPVGSFDYNPKDGDSVGVANLVNASIALDGVAVNGYDAVRAHGFADLSGLVGTADSGKIVLLLPYSSQL